VAEGRVWAEVEREGDTLVLTWAAGDPVAVEVFDAAGGSAIARHGPDQTGRLVLDGLDPDQRYHLHISHGEAESYVVAERLVRLEGTLNFRDLGGYVGEGGRRVRWGRVFRSDHLSGLTEADVGRLERLGVRTIVDYQGAHERAGDTPRPLPPTFRRLERPIVDGPAPGVTFYDRVMDKSLTTFDTAGLTGFYLRTLERSATVFGEVLGVIADPAHHAVVFHCRAGKDRTGLTAALLLGALGVADDDILDDYLLTNRYRSGRRMEVLRPQLAEQGIDIDDFIPLFVAPREALADTLVGVAERYGSVAGYLRQAAGLSEATLSDLRRHLLT
jgi:protein-tyrosine phosphatase